MNEINEAYDMLNNPQKYKSEGRQNSLTNRTYGNPYNQSGWNASEPQGGFGEFTGFDFEDIFEFTRQYYESVRPTVMAGDGPEIRQAIDLINMIVKIHQWEPENGYRIWIIDKKYDTIVNRSEFNKSKFAEMYEAFRRNDLR